MEFHTREGVAKAVNGVDYSVRAGETLAILGESGSGKSVSAQAVMGILDSPPAKITGGEILFKGRDLLDARHRGAPQDPRRADGDGLPGRALLAEPGAHRRHAARRDVPGAPRA